MIVKGKLLFLENSAMSHFEWARTLGVDEKTFEQLVRGYYKDGEIVFYKGNFVYDDECVRQAQRFATKIKTRANQTKVKVWCGLKVGKIGENWSPIFFVGEF